MYFIPVLCYDQYDQMYFINLKQYNKGQCFFYQADIQTQSGFSSDLSSLLGVLAPQQILRN